MTERILVTGATGYIGARDWSPNCLPRATRW